jgi:hypothetical protein
MAKSLDLFHVPDLQAPLTQEDRLTLIAKIDCMEKDFIAGFQATLAGFGKIMENIAASEKVLEDVLRHMEEMKERLWSETERKGIGHE